VALRQQIETRGAGRPRRLRRGVALAGAAALSTAAAGAAAPGRLHGTVLRGPITPVCRAGVPCDAPAGGLTLTFRGAGIVRSVRTDLHGAYRVVLPAGTYAVRTSSKPFGLLPKPASVGVHAGASQRVNFTIDTGIR
jgi:hypothetical protein